MRMEALFAPDDEVVLEIQGTKALAMCWERYRDNHRGPLIFAPKDGVELTGSRASGPGMRWSEPGARDVADARVLLFNDK